MIQRLAAEIELVEGLHLVQGPMQHGRMADACSLLGRQVLRRLEVCMQPLQACQSSLRDRVAFLRR